MSTYTITYATISCVLFAVAIVSRLVKNIKVSIVLNGIKRKVKLFTKLDNRLIGLCVIFNTFGIALALIIELPKYLSIIHR